MRCTPRRLTEPVVAHTQAQVRSDAPAAETGELHRHRRLLHHRLRPLRHRAANPRSSARAAYSTASKDFRIFLVTAAGILRIRGHDQPVARSALLVARDPAESSLQFGGDSF